MPDEKKHLSPCWDLLGFVQGVPSEGAIVA